MNELHDTSEPSGLPRQVPARKTPSHILERIREARNANPEAFRKRDRDRWPRRKERVNARKKRLAAQVRKEQAERMAAQARTNLGRAPQTLNEWFPTQTHFRTWRQFARAIGAGVMTVFDWRRQIQPPLERYRQRLFEITKLECYGPETVGLSSEFSMIVDGADNWAASIGLIPTTRRRFVYFLSSSFRKVNLNGISRFEAVTPAIFTKYGHVCSRARRHQCLILSGKFFVARKLWQESDLQRLRDEIDRLGLGVVSGSHSSPRPVPIPLLYDLVIRNGFDWGKLRRLTIPEVESEGLRFADGLFVRFGEGMHQVRRDAFDSWMAKTEPSALLFCKPREKRHWKTRPMTDAEPMSKLKLWRCLRATGVQQKMRVPYRMLHFEEEFRQNPNPRWMRIHLQRTHRLGYAESGRIVIRLERTIGVHLPVPYLLAVMAISQLCSCKPKQLRGKACTFTWPDLKGYEVTVRWPKTFADVLRDNRVRPGVARTLLRMAVEAWKQQRKLYGSGWFVKLDQSLARRLELTQVQIKNLKSGYIWRGSVLSRRPFFVLDRDKHSRRLFRKGHSRYFNLPLLEHLEGGLMHAHCRMCRHADRLLIDEEIRSGVSLSELVKRHGLPRDYRKHILPKHVEHVSSGPCADVAKIPGNFLTQIANGTPLVVGAKILALLH